MFLKRLRSCRVCSQLCKAWLMSAARLKEARWEPFLGDAIECYARTPTLSSPSVPTVLRKQHGCSRNTRSGSALPVFCWRLVPDTESQITLDRREAILGLGPMMNLREDQPNV